jgi:acyl-homoserine-lactone acylase
MVEGVGARGRTSRRWAAIVAIAAIGGLAVVAAPASAYRVTIRRTAHGIPHIVAGDYGSLGYGYAYAFAQDAICELADQYVTVDARRAEVFGPDGTYDFSQSNGTTPNNLESDLYYEKLNKLGTVERLLAVPVSQGGPKPEIKEAVKGYVAGWNRRLADIGGPSGITDPACKGKPWVRPITEIEAYRRFYQLSLLASSGFVLSGIANAAPKGAGLASSAATARQARAAATSGLGRRFERLLGGLGSNAVALGKAATADGRGLVLGNPHFPWDGSARFYESQLTIPGKIDVAGASLYGAPIVNIGFTRGLAWSHTVSTARRFVPYELQLVPGDPHSYLVDGRAKKMVATTVTVRSRQPDGSLKPVTRTLYDTEYGPMFDAIQGLPLFPWTAAKGYALYDGNAENFGRLFNHFFDVNRAQSVPELDAIERRWQGIPWVNTIAADKDGRAYYADIGSMPNVDEPKRADCETAFGVALDQAVRVQVLDGARGACAPGSAPGAAAPGLLPPSRQPVLLRDDYVTNSNDSYWLTNPLHPLEGFPRLIGDERTERAARTRLGLRIVQQRLDGSDGAGRGGSFTPRQLMDAVFNNRQYLGELWRDPLVAMCRSNATLAGSSGPVDVSGACPVLAAWDLRDDLGSRGAVLFRRFAVRAVAITGGAFTTPFSESDPVNTPRGLDTTNPQVKAALADAVRDLRDAGLALDVPLGQVQYEMRGGERIPIHGGPDGVGDFNVITADWDPRRGYPNVYEGSSYVQVVRTTGGCPDAHTILTYSQSPDPTSRWYADQTRMFSRKQWMSFPFCDGQIGTDAGLALTNLGGGYAGYAQTGTAARLLRRVRVRRAGRRALRVTIVTGASTVVTVWVRRAGRTVASVRVRTVGGRSRRVTLRGLPAGPVRVRVTARSVAGGLPAGWSSGRLSLG